MNKTVVRLTFLCVGLVFTSLVLTSISEAQVDMAGARAIWLFDEGEGDTAGDISGNDYHAALVNDPTWVGGKFGTALSFDGEDDYVEANAPVVVETVDFTMGLWVNPGETQKQWANILSSHGGDPGPPVNCEGMSIEQNSDSPNLFYFIGGGAPRQCWLGQAAKTQLETGVWQHFVVVRKDGKLTHYLNGEVSVEGSAQRDTPYALSTHTFRIGNWSRGPDDNRGFNGMVDDVFLFERALSHDEIMSLMDVGFAVPGAVSPAGKIAAAWGSIKTQF
jgi:hypothetical protein